MNKHTILKLQGNPHYKLSPEQKAEAELLLRNPMINIGEAVVHNNKVEKHPVEVKKRKVLKDE